MTLPPKSIILVLSSQKLEQLTLRQAKRRKEGTFFMQGTKPRTVNSIGMFDLLKGTGMITIVLAHTAELYPLQLSDGLSLTAFFPFIYREALMAAFYIASGYGFRKRSVSKCVKQQCKSLLKPYLYTALFTSVLHLIVHYSCFHYLPGSLFETYKVAGGFVLGLPHTASYFGQEFFSTGPMWYLLALLVGWVLLDAILNIFPEKYTHWAVLGVMLLGWATTLVWELPFCLAQGAVVVPYLYIGYLAKQNRWLDKPLSRRAKWVLLGGTVLTAVGAMLARSTDCISMGEWTMGPLSILLDGMTGFLFIKLFVKLNRFTGPVVQFLEGIGRQSLNIFCIHTVELIAIPWYLFAAHYAERPLAGIGLQFLLSVVSIWLVCLLLQRRRDRIIKTAPARRKAAAGPRHYAARH